MAPRKEPLWRRYLRFFGPDVNADVEEELRFHLEMRERNYLARGFSPEEARRAARKKFGDFDQHRRALRRQDGRRLWRNNWSERLGEWTQDLRFAFRMLWHRRGFSSAVIATLALGIGATTAMFSAVDAAMLRPLPFVQPERLVELPEVQLPFAINGKELAPNGIPGIRDVGAMPRIFSRVGVYALGGLNLSGAGAPARVQVGVVTTGFFPTFGIHPALGRWFTEEEGRPGGETIAILSHRLWRQLGGGNISGQSVRLNGKTYQLVGVMPSGFAFPEGAELWIPMTIPMTWESFAPFRGAIMQTIVARLAPGASLETARGAVRALWERASIGKQKQYQDPRLNPVRPLQGTLVGDRREPMLILLGATALLLLIACVNVTNLLLAHGASRERELALRAVLGASKGRLLRQMLVQSLVLSLAGAAGGLALASLTLGAVQALMPKQISVLAAPRLDFRLLAFAIGLAFLAGLAVGLWPALGAARSDAQAALKAGGAHGATAAGRRKLRRGLVVAELALALMLLAGAGLMLRSFRTLIATNPGFATEHVATLQVVLERSPGLVYRSPVPTLLRLVDQVQRVPGIAAAGLVNDLPMSGQVRVSLRIYTEGAPHDASGKQAFARYLIASAGYFKTMGIPLLQGRLMAESDDSVAPKVAVVNEAMAREYWPGQVPIGKRFQTGEMKDFYSVIGLVGDTRERLDEPAGPQAYLAITSEPIQAVSLVARGALPEAELLGALRNAVRAVDPAQAVYNVRMMDEMLSTSLAPRWSNTLLISAFGFLALVLALVGVYGVVSYNVVLRTRELGIRAALGASRGALVRLVLREGLAVAGVGVGLGLGGAFALSRVLRSLLYGVGPADPPSYVAAAFVLLVPVLGATLIPARRAAAANPVEVIRTE